MNGSSLTSAAARETVRHLRPAAAAAQPAAAEAGARTSAHKLGLIIGVLSIAVFMSSLDLFIVNLAFPYIGRDYPGTTLSSLSWVLNAYTIVFAAVLVPAGRWADRIGRRRVFVAGLAAFSAGSLLSGLTPSVAAHGRPARLRHHRRGQLADRSHFGCPAAHRNRIVTVLWPNGLPAGPATAGYVIQGCCGG